MADQEAGPAERGTETGPEQYGEAAKALPEESGDAYEHWDDRDWNRVLVDAKLTVTTECRVEDPDWGTGDERKTVVYGERAVLPEGFVTRPARGDGHLDSLSGPTEDELRQIEEWNDRIEGENDEALRRSEYEEEVREAGFDDGDGPRPVEAAKSPETGGPDHELVMNVNEMQWHTKGTLTKIEVRLETPRNASLVVDCSGKPGDRPGRYTSSEAKVDVLATLDSAAGDITSIKGRNVELHRLGKGRGNARAYQAERAEVWHTCDGPGSADVIECGEGSVARGGRRGHDNARADAPGTGRHGGTERGEGGEGGLPRVSGPPKEIREQGTPSRPDRGSGHAPGAAAQQQERSAPTR